MARVVLARRTRREILDLDRQVADAVSEALGLLEREPEAGHELRGRRPLRGLRSLRVGSYRVVYQLVDDETLRVVAVRHRAVAYATDPR